MKRRKIRWSQFRSRSRFIFLVLLLAIVMYYLNDRYRKHFESRTASSVLIIDDKLIKQTGRKLTLDVPRSGQVPESESKTWHVPRGQSFFYSTFEALRLASFETWRPKEKVGMFRTKKCTAKQQQDNILLIMQTSSATAWQNIPIQLLTLLQDFKDFVIYSEFADSIGGTEILDALVGTHPSLTEKSTDFEPYRIMRTIRESHVRISADEVSIPSLAKLKKYMMLSILYKTYEQHPNRDWYIVVEDRTTLFENNLRSVLQKLDPLDTWYLGSAVEGPAKILFASGESGIVLSQGLMKKAFKMSPREASNVIYHDHAVKTRYECCGDYMLAKYLKTRSGIELDVVQSANYFQNEPLSSVKISARNWCSAIGSLGNQRPRDIELMADYMEVKSHSLILYSDIYLDFVKPYLNTEVQQNWDNGANDIEFTPDAAEQYTNAYRSLDECRKACLDIKQCLMLRYDKYTQYCGLSISSLALGKPVIQYATKTNMHACHQYKIQCHPRTHTEIMSSEWFIDRIREMRKTLKCDPLFKDPGSEGTEYGALDQVEGWWHRAKMDTDVFL